MALVQPYSPDFRVLTPVTEVLRGIDVGVLEGRDTSDQGLDLENLRAGERFLVNSVCAAASTLPVAEKVLQHAVSIRNDLGVSSASYQYCVRVETPLVTAGWPADPDARRGIAARVMVAEDARWVQDVVLSTKGSDAGASAALLLGHHFVRIAYEGSLTLRSEWPFVGVPQLASHLTGQFEAITARARHMSKLLDDKKKSQQEVLDEIGTTLKVNRRVFLEKVHPLIRWCATDLGMYSIDGRIVGTTVPMSYRLGLDVSSQRTMFEEAISEVTHEWGATMAVLGSADLVLPAEPSLDLGSFTISDQDVRSSKYLAGRYDPVLKEQEKLLVLMIEGDLNCNETYLPTASRGHEQAAFRLRVVSLFHSLRAVKSLVARCTSDGARQVQSVLEDAPTRRLLSRSGAQVRNRCVHYPITDKRVAIDPALPMFGIVESVFPGETFESLDSTVNAVTARMAEALSSWNR